MAKTDFVELPGGIPVPILYEDRSVLAIDKPAGWMLGPEDEEHARRNLHLGLTAGIDAGEWWARCRNLKYIRFIHRLDAPTTGILLLAKSPGVIPPFTRLFASRTIGKTYLAITDGIPKEVEWRCDLPLGPEPGSPGRHQVDPVNGKEASTLFRVLGSRGGRALVEARPLSGRTHQIRLHLLAAGCPVTGDILYGRHHPAGLGLRAVEMTYNDPFTHRPIRIRAPREGFSAAFGFNKDQAWDQPGAVPSPPSQPAKSATSPKPPPPAAPPTRPLSPNRPATGPGQGPTPGQGGTRPDRLPPRRPPTSRPGASRPSRRDPRGR
jgi:23S rRNA-/tRNA-specific pseudouridylate synthase